MEKTLTSVGNSKAIIIPADMIKKFNLDKVTLEATEDGILIKPVADGSTFFKKMEVLRKTKALLYSQLEKEAVQAETIAFYADPGNVIGDIDLDILEP
jgi:antitoxin component of MazEF toxin-antitoxin module